MTKSLAVTPTDESLAPIVPRALTGVLTEQPVVAVTFDDGPDPLYTPRLLDILAANDARATFFMIGARAQRHPELVAQVAAEGHAIGNHSWDHPSFPFISREERREQLQACAEAIFRYDAGLFRPPYGHLDLDSWLDVDQMGYRAVAWKIDPGDWDDKPASAIVEAVMAQVRPGAVVLLHDGLFDAPESGFFPRDATISAVGLLLDRLRGAFRFVTIPQLLKCGTPHWKRWNYVEPKDELNRLSRRDGSARRY
jgi:peptidoglycan/xylan/chitin deacetylase (PgdA/CDA1 family)